MEWRSYIIRRIPIFPDRVVGSLRPEELQQLIPWVKKVQTGWERVDDEIKRHFAAILLRMQEAGIIWKLASHVVLPDLEAGPESEFATPIPSRESEPSPSRQYGLKLPMPLAPLQSEIPVAPLRPAPIGVRPRPATAETPSDEEVPESSDDRRAHEARAMQQGVEELHPVVSQSEAPSSVALEALPTPVVEHAGAEQMEELSGPRGDEPPESVSVSQESTNYQRVPIKELLAHYGIVAIHPAAELLPEIGDE